MQYHPMLETTDNKMQLIIFTAFLAAATASSISAPAATTILQGPSTKTTIVGPEGSVIQAVAPGGKIIQEEHPGYVAQSASAQHSAHGIVAPVLGTQYSSPILTNHGAYSASYSSPGISYQNYGSRVLYGAHHEQLNGFGQQSYHVPIVANYGSHQIHHLY